MLKEGVEVLYDDRAVSAGILFSDADLLGVPIRLTVSPRNRKAGCVECSFRGDRSHSLKIPLEETIPRITEEIRKAMEALL